MKKSELKTYPTLIKHTTEKYELKAGTIGTHSIGSLKIKFQNWLNIADNPTLGSLACKGINKIYT